MIKKLSPKFCIPVATALVLQMALSTTLIPQAEAMGPVAIPAPVRPMTAVPHRTKQSSVTPKTHHYAGSVKIKSGKFAKSKKKTGKKSAMLPPPPQTFVDQLASRTIAPGVVHKVHRGAMFINLLDVDLARAGVQVKPVMAGEKFDTLDEVKDQAAKVHAIAAINGNYFKRDGTPLGTLIIDGEWISGPLLDRTCMGVTPDGRVLVDRVSMHGILETSNPDVRSIWVNNINQPRRHGAHLIAYTRRWGDTVRLPYQGVLVAVDNTGHVIDKAPQVMGIPYGGYVFSDTKEGAISRLQVGDLVNLTWRVSPNEWSTVTNAVSGGPVLIRDGKLFVDCKEEGFRKSWTSNSIHARTAVGVTADRHLLLATIEGPHTLYDVAKFFLKLGAVDAMNLDGGGSTTMVIGQNTVTKNQNTFQRRVASSLAVLPRGAGRAYGDGTVIYRGGSREVVIPAGSLLDFGAQLPQNQLPENRNSYELVETNGVLPSPVPAQRVNDALATQNNTIMMPAANYAAPLQSKPKKHFGWMHSLNPFSKE